MAAQTWTCAGEARPGRGISGAPASRVGFASKPRSVIVATNSLQLDHQRAAVSWALAACPLQPPAFADLAVLFLLGSRPPRTARNIECLQKQAIRPWSKRVHNAKKAGSIRRENIDYCRYKGLPQVDICKKAVHTAFCDLAILLRKVCVFFV